MARVKVVCCRACAVEAGFAAGLLSGRSEAPRSFLLCSSHRKGRPSQGDGSRRFSRAFSSLFFLSALQLG